MARVISSFTTEATGSIILAQKELINKFIGIFISLGFVSEYDNFDSATVQGNSGGTGVISNYKIFTTSAFTTELAQRRISSPCGRFKIVFYCGNIMTSNQTNATSAIVFIPGGIGDSTSLFPASNGMHITMQATSTTSRVYNYEILSKGSSFEVYCAREGVTADGFSLSYNVPQPLTQESLPDISFLRIFFSTSNFATVSYTGWQSYGGGYISNLWAALSNTLIGAGVYESALGAFNGSSFPLRQSVVNIETALMPMVWANTGAYRVDNFFLGRSTYPPNVISGIILLNNKQYRVLTSQAEGFICYAID